ncbi:hypothetical protein [Streptomyces goshikiensis]|uniref:hypothetical protein n=1 Tax=Streptomyces goshikiensis TaxID=1942 RepID=UPI003792706B
MAEQITPQLEDFSLACTFRTADGRRTAEVTNDTITVFEGPRIIAVTPTTDHHRRYPGSIWDVINGAVDEQVIELAQTLDFIASATARAARPELGALPLPLLVKRLSSDRAMRIMAEAYDFHRSMGDIPARAAGRAGARALRAAIPFVDEVIVIVVGQAVEAAYVAQHQN